jgi:prephenate dehydratase
MRIGVLGLKGSYSEKAAKQWIAKNVAESDNILEHCSDIQDVFSLLENKECDIGVVPLENSIEGSVGVTLDLLLEKDVNIIGETIVNKALPSFKRKGRRHKGDIIASPGSWTMP